MTIGVAVIAIITIGYLGQKQGRDALRDSVWNQLTGLKAARQRQIEDYFQDIFDQMRTFSENRMIVDASKSFVAASEKLKTVELSESEQESLERFYTSTFIPELDQATESSSEIDLLAPKNPEGRVIQTRYIANNPNPPGDKQQMNASGDGSEYDEAHQFYHPLLRNIAERFHYYDLFVIDPKTGVVVYTVYKEPDLGTSVLDGPYRGSGLASVYRTARDRGQRAAIELTDIEPYKPSLMAPAQFLATPVFDDSEMVAIIAVQIPIVEINRIMTGARSWESDGLGSSGETYLVGDDFLMRSGSRFMIESPQDYLKDQESRGGSPEMMRRLRITGTSILAQQVRTPMAEAAVLRGESDTQIGLDYRGVEVLSSYAPVNIPGLRWAILSEMDETEAFAPIRKLSRLVWTAASAIILGVTLLAMFFSWLFLRPVEQLVAGAEKVGKGETDVKVKVHSRDELGRLARTFNGMVGKLNDQEGTYLGKIEELESFIGRVIPFTFYQKLGKESGTLAENFDPVTVVYARLVGVESIFDRYAENEKGVADAVKEFDELIGLLDDAAARHGVETISVNGTVYQVACGVPTPRVDHAFRCVSFAVETEKLLQAYGQKHDFELHAQVGIDSGEVAIGVVGRNRVSYSLFGPAVYSARSLVRHAGEQAGVFISNDVWEALEDDFEVEEIANDDGCITWKVTGETSA